MITYCVIFSEPFLLGELFLRCRGNFIIRMHLPFSGMLNFILLNLKLHNEWNFAVLPTTDGCCPFTDVCYPTSRSTPPSVSRSSSMHDGVRQSKLTGMSRDVAKESHFRSCAI